MVARAAGCFLCLALLSDSLLSVVCVHIAAL